MSSVRYDQLKETVLATEAEGSAVIVNVVFDNPPPLFLLLNLIVLLGAVPEMVMVALGGALMVQFGVA
jgi:hypothetical protein